MGRNTANVPTVWGEADVQAKYLKTEQPWLSLRKSPVGKVPDLCIITTTVTSQGTGIQQLLLQDIVEALGMHRERNRQNPCLMGPPFQRKSKRSTSLETVSRFIHVNLYTLQTGSVR